METNENPVNALLEGAEAYTKTSFELLKLRVASKVSDVFTMVIYHFFVVVILSFFLFGVSVAVALWLGELLGKVSLGFIAVGFFYGLLGAVLFLIRPGVRTVIYNSVLGNILHKAPKS
jgi:hypothetical protein